MQLTIIYIGAFFYSFRKLVVFISILLFNWAQYHSVISGIITEECIDGVCETTNYPPTSEGDCNGDHCPTEKNPSHGNEGSTTPYWNYPEGFDGDIGEYNEDTFKAVIQDVLDDTDKETVPKLNFSEPLELRILFDLLSLASFDELSGEISLVASLTLQWSAETTPRWNPNFMLGGKESVTISAEDVWRPQLFVLNPSKKVQDLTSNLNRLRLGYDGLVEWNIVTILEVSIEL